MIEEVILEANILPAVLVGLARGGLTDIPSMI